MKILKKIIIVFTSIALILLSSCKDEPVIVKPETSIVTVTEIGKTSINYSFSLVNNGGELNEIGICWDTANYPTISKNKLVLDINASNFSNVLVNLIPGTQYYIRSYAINSAGTEYSESSSFKTFMTYYEGTIADVDGNEYEIIRIGQQIWMSENLKTTKLNDNTIIPVVADNNSWSETNQSACCWYSNNQNENVETHGALYNHAVIETDKLCPDGYHVPTIQDWTMLQNYLIANHYNFDGSSSGNKFAKSLSAKTDWAYNGADGCIGNNLENNNATGFNALPSGLRNISGNYVSRDYATSFWTSDILDQDNSYSIDFFNSSSAIYINSNPKKDGFSVRCIKD